MKVNLISDTVTQPTEGMLAAMHSAPVGDDVFKEDPSVNELEEKVAKLFGMEAALFFPSGTMANQTAIKLHTQPGEQLICDHYSHIFNYEGGGVSFNSGVSCALVEGDKGRITADQIKTKINPSDFYHSPKTALVSLENTTNKGGGACYDLKEMLAINRLCANYQLPLHLDGARLWNAMISTQTRPEDYAVLFDTISVCFSKGLGAPVGSALLGSKVLIDQALRIRKILGGGMRQAGYLAAAASYAIDYHWKEMQYDHDKAKELESSLRSLPMLKYIAPVETNIIIFEFETEEIEQLFFDFMIQHQIQLIQMGSGKLRFVTHRDYTDDQHQFVLYVISKFKL